MTEEPTTTAGEGVPAGEPRADAILTIPNLLSVVRLLCVPIFLWLLFGAEEPYAAAWLLGGLGATDWVDGFVARRFGQVSELGKVLDPTADRILLGVGMLSIVIDGSVPLWVGLAALVREVLVGLAAIVLGMLGARRIDVQWAGKAGTFSMMFAFPFFLASEAGIWWADAARFLAWFFTVPGLAFGWYAAAMYIPRAKVALEEGRVGSGR